MSRFLPLRVKRIERETPDSVKVTLDTEGYREAFDFLPGQYITFCFNLKGDDLRRAYSLCTAPHENEIQVAVKEIDAGRVSVHANRTLKVGDPMQVMPPEGNFFLQTSPEAQRHIVLFGAGSGITPLISIAKAVLHDEPLSRVTLFYGNKGRESIMFYRDLDRLAQNNRMDVYHILTDGSTGTPLFSGRITFGKTLELLYNFVNDDLDKEYFVCGPSGMMTSVKNALTDAEIPKEKIHLEYFENPDKPATQKVTPTPAAIQEKEFGQRATVELVLDAATFNFAIEDEKKSVLDAALAAGADAPFSCQGGVCTSCRAKLLEGSVRMDSNFALTDQELKEGYILTCQAHPTSAHIKVSYDD
jgi:ring-1,2-phenylacetyl-CoA epoxidase subunit PaaE